MRLPIAAIKIGSRCRKDMGNVKALADSIAEIGLLHPIVVRPDSTLSAGQRRLEAAKLLGWDEIPATTVDLDEVARGEFAENMARKSFTPKENMARKSFTPKEEVAIWRALEPLERKAAEARMRAGKPCGNLPQGGGKTRDSVAAYVRKSGRTLERQVAIVEAAEAEPEKYGKFLDDMERTGKVNGVYKRLVVARKAEAIKKEPPPLPEGPFRVIVADPPWPYELWKVDPSHRGTHPYPQMSIEQIKALPVSGLAADDCILWLWTTNHHMREAFEVLDIWGFKHKTILTWIKDKMGMGDWLRGQTEHCLMAVRGKPVVTLTNQTTALSGPVRAHSEKPDEFYQLVEALCPAPPNGRAELFQRMPRDCWVCHGDEVEAVVAEARRAGLIREEERAAFRDND